MVAGTGGASSGPADPKLVALRQQMAAADGGKGVDVYVVPTEDPHMVRGGRKPRPLAPAASWLYFASRSPQLCAALGYDLSCINGRPSRPFRDSVSSNTGGTTVDRLQNATRHDACRRRRRARSPRRTRSGAPTSQGSRDPPAPRWLPRTRRCSGRTAAISCRCPLRLKRLVLPIASACWSAPPADLMMTTSVMLYEIPRRCARSRHSTRVPRTFPRCVNHINAHV